MPESRRLPVPRGRAIAITFDDERIACFEGETIAAALLAAGISAFGVTRDGAPRAPFCNMGTCFECAVTVNGRPLVRACLTPVVDGMAVEQTKGY